MIVSAAKRSRPSPPVECRISLVIPAKAGILAVGLWLVATGALAGASHSTCFGSAQSGRLERGVPLPFAGANHASYSAVGWLAGRMYVHSRVASAVTAAFGSLATAAPGKTYLVGETGTAIGGRFPPHRTHQNGTSVDFMVPVLLDGRSVPLPTSVANQFGYAIEFDDRGRWGAYRIDFEALGEHLYQLEQAARREGIGISRVILEVPLQQALWRTRRGAWLRQHLPFSTRRAWVRHDEHYHVDFRVACRP